MPKIRLKTAPNPVQKIIVPRAPQKAFRRRPQWAYKIKQNKDLFIHSRLD
jgi:hypothetical protein